MASDRFRVLRGGPVMLGAAILALCIESRPLALGGLHVYQRLIAPAAARMGFRCRFTPTCSRYAETVIVRDGVVSGGWNTLKRISRCGPWTKMGTVDEP